MGNIKLEVVALDDEFEGDEEDAKELVQQFLEESSEHIDVRRTTVEYPDGTIEEEINGYDRHSEIFWFSIAILLTSNPRGVIEFLRWASEIPGLTMGLSMDGDYRIKLFSDNDFTLIDNSTEYNVESLGKVEEYRDDEDYVPVKIHIEDWRHLRDDIDTGELDIELPPEDEIGP